MELHELLEDLPKMSEEEATREVLDMLKKGLSSEELAEIPFGAAAI